MIDAEEQEGHPNFNNGTLDIITDRIITSKTVLVRAPNSWYHTAGVHKDG